MSETRNEIVGASSAWSGPNERTEAVDAASVRIERALDATVLHHALVRAVGAACAARIALDTENDPAVPPVPGQSLDQLLQTMSKVVL